MKLLVASSYFPTKSALQDLLKVAGIGAEMTFVETIDEVINELMTNSHDLLITDAEIDQTDIWHLSKLVYSTKLAVHSIPLWVIKETCSIEIPELLAKEHAFKLVSLNDLGVALQVENSQYKTGNKRGRQQTEKPTLLIIEDDEDAAFSMSYALSGTYAIDIAVEGQAGFDLWQDKRHDLVLLDFMLPDINGDIVLEKIMAVDENQPVIVMTAFDRAEYNKNLLLNGASEYLPKPLILDDLRAKCQIIITRAKLIQLEQNAESKNHTLRNLTVILNNAISEGNLDKAKRVMEKIKTFFPGEFTEDELIKLSSLEF
jgi:DNA-binding response OmpR family regulator